MPQIGWLEILIIVVLAILIIGPKDFPFMLKKIGRWIGSVKEYLADFKKDFDDIKNTTENEISAEKEISNDPNEIKKDEWRKKKAIKFCWTSYWTKIKIN